MKKLLLFTTAFLLLSCNGLAQETKKKEEAKIDLSPDSYSYWHEKQKTGLGFFQIITPDSIGFGTFYDRNLSPMTQFHSSFSFESISSGGYSSQDDNFFDRTYSSIFRNILKASLRRFLSSDHGFFIGAGAGLMEASFRYHDYSYNSDGDYNSKAEENASAQGNLVFAELGWQGKTGYFFEMSLQAGTMLDYSDNYTDTNIIKLEDRQIASNHWAAVKDFTAINVNFGWFF